MPVKGLPLVAIVLLWLAPTAARSQPSKGLFDHLRNEWISDLEAQRLEPALRHYDAEATFINPNGTHADGVAAIRSLYSAVFAAVQARIQMTPRSASVSGDLAYESGSYTEQITDRKTHQTSSIRGDYLTVYRRDKTREWRIAQQAWTEGGAAR